MIDKALHLLEFILLMLCMFFTAKVYIQQHNIESDLRIQVINLEKEVKESEERCKRLTDSCIYIMANNEWEK
jgi:hypothetical protein